jgi:hypothetical protein
MQDLRQKITGKEDLQGKLKSLASSVPGFGGYFAKDSRRDADKLLRLHLAGKLADERKRMRAQATKLGAANLQKVRELDKSIGRLQTLTDKIKNATYGAGSLFDAVRVKEEQLDALYTYDNSMLDGVPLLTTAITALAAAVKAKEGVDEALEAVDEAVDKLATAWNLRQDVLLQS